MSAADHRLVASVAQGGLALTLRTPSGADLPLRRGRGLAFALAVPSGVLDIATAALIEEPALFGTDDGGLGAVALRRTAVDVPADTVLVGFTAVDGLLEERFTLSLGSADVSEPRVDELPDGSLRLSWCVGGTVVAARLRDDHRLGESVEPPVDPAEPGLAVSTALAEALVARYGVAAPAGTSEVFVRDRADPSIVPWQGEYLFIATDERLDERDRPGLLLRRAASIDALAEAPDHLIVGTGPAGIEGCFWAPELHELDGVLWCLFSPSIGSPRWADVRSHAMRLRPGGDPTRSADWDAPVPVLSESGGPLELDREHPGVSLDMTLFTVGDRGFAVWSQRYLVDGVIGDADLWIATVDGDDPTRLTSSATRICTPELAWESAGANVVEGAFAVVHGDTLLLVYSAAAVGPDYAVGVLSAPVDGDLLAPATWTKTPYPLLDADPDRGIWGPGHGMITRDEEGTPLFVHHALTDPAETRRHAVLRRFGWTAAGLPALDDALAYTLPREHPGVAR